MRPGSSCLYTPHSISSFLWVSAIYMDSFTVQSLCLTWYLIWKNGIDGCAWMLEIVSLIWFMTSMLISTTKWSLNAPFWYISHFYKINFIFQCVWSPDWLVKGSSSLWLLTPVFRLYLGICLKGFNLRRKDDLFLWLIFWVSRPIPWLPRECRKWIP